MNCQENYDTIVEIEKLRIEYSNLINKIKYEVDIKALQELLTFSTTLTTFKIMCRK